MITVPELAAEALGSFLADRMARRFGSTDASFTEVIPSAARLALDCIGNSDALYHNVEHTMLVTLAGYDIMRGRALLMPTNARDFSHVITTPGGGDSWRSPVAIADDAAMNSCNSGTRWSFMLPNA